MSDLKEQILKEFESMNWIEIDSTNWFYNLKSRFGLTNYHKLVPYILSIHNHISSESWNNIKQDWIDFQNNIPKYMKYNARMCPECDGMFKWDKDEYGTLHLQDQYVDRKYEIESFTGIRVINLTSDSIFYYYKNKRKLLNIVKTINYEIKKLSD